MWISILTNYIIHNLKIYDPILVNYTLKTCLNGVVTQSRENYLYIREYSKELMIDSLLEKILAISSFVLFRMFNVLNWIIHGKERV